MKTQVGTRPTLCWGMAEASVERKAAQLAVAEAAAPHEAASLPQAAALAEAAPHQAASLLQAAALLEAAAPQPAAQPAAAEGAAVSGRAGGFLGSVSHCSMVPA